MSGKCDLGPSCFVGVNATIGNDVSVGPDCLIGAGAGVLKDVPADTLVRATPSDVGKVSARRFFKVAEAA